MNIHMLTHGVHCQPLLGKGPVVLWSLLLIHEVLQWARAKSLE